MQVEDVARICHEANKAYCFGIGDTSQPSWEDAPEWQKQSAVKGVEFHLVALRAGNRPSPSASHEAWLNEKRRDRGGWKWGPVKNPDTMEHPCFLPYDELPPEQRGKDYVFAGIVESLFHAKMI